jgi:RNA polymerase sigma-70 factor (ECF subfamily)
VNLPALLAGMQAVIMGRIPGVAMDAEPEEITVLLRRLRQGDEVAAEELWRLVYEELRRIARAYMRKEAPGRTLQTTALVHEAWLRLADQTQVDWQDRTHFYRVAARMMRRVLVDHARARLADKRGAGATKVSLEWVEIEPTPQKLEEVLAVDEVLSRLSEFDQQQARIAEMRYFAGMTVDETATALGLSSRTVEREWALASAWLRAELSRKGAA